MPAAVPVIAAALTKAAIIKFVATVAISLALGAYQQSRSRKKAREAERAQRDAYNASLKDRHITVRSGVSTRKYVLGTIRVGGTLMHIESNGHHNTALDSVLALASNKCELTGYYIGDDYVPAVQFPGDKWGKRKQTDKTERFNVQPGAHSATVDLGAQIVPGSVRLVGWYDPDSWVHLSEPRVTGSVVEFDYDASGHGRITITYKTYEAEKIRAIFKDGDPDQEGSDWGDVATPLWTAGHRLRGVAHLRVLNLWDEDLYHAGAPQMSAVLRGGWVGRHRFFDPRTNTYPVHTTNPALLSAWWMTMPRALGGMGIPDSWIDWPCVSIAANICDEQIRVRTLDGQGYESIKRYECHTLIDTGNPPVENLNIILSSMAGEYVFTAGMYRIFAGAFRTATVTITDDDVVGDKDIAMDKSGQDDAPANIVTSTFINASRNWLESSPRPIKNDAYLTLDGAESPLDLPLPATTDERQAAYLMGVALESARPAFAGRISVLGIGEDIAVLDTVQLNLSNRPQYAGRTFQVINRIDNWDGTFELTLQETRANVWALDPDTFLPSDPTPTPDNSYLWNIAPIVGFTVSPQKPQALADGVAVVRVDLSWGPHQQPYVLQGGRIETRYRAPGDEWIWNPPVPGDATGTSFTATLIDGVTYQYQARAVSGTGATSNWTDGWNEYDGMVEAPPALTGLSTESILAGINISWTFPGTKNALRHTQIRYGIGSEFDSSIKLGDYAWPTDSASLLNLAAGAELWFWGRLVDENGTPSPWHPAENKPGIRGQASADVGLILDGLTQEIVGSALGQQLMGNIRDIPNIRDTVDSALAETGLQAQKIADNAQAIAKEVIDRGTAVAAEAQARIDGQVVAAQALADGLTAEAQARGAAITTEKTERQAADASLAGQINTVTAAVGDNAAAIRAEELARASGDSAEANARQTLAVQVRGDYSGSDVNQVSTGLIGGLKRVVAGNHESVVQQMSQLQAGIGEQFDYAKMWYWEGVREGWSSGTIVDGSWLRPADSIGYVVSPRGLNVNGAEYSQVRLRLKKVGSPAWAPIVGLYASDATGSNYTMHVPAQPDWDENGIGVIVFTHTHQGVIDGIILRGATPGTLNADNYYAFDWFAIGRPAPGASTAALNNEAKLRATADIAEATSRETLSVKLTGKADPTSVTLPNVTSGLIFDERQARVSGDEAAMTEITGLKARMPAGTGKVATEASVTTEAQARATADAALANRATALESRMPTGNGKLATADAVSALDTRVEQTESKQTSTASDVTQLKTSVTTAQNTANSAQTAANAAQSTAAAAQTAAQAVSDKADGKGEVIYGSTVPAAAKRLTQNLWIDTTGNANTPKRWNGTAWVAVTDKVATDAVAAAAQAKTAADTAKAAADAAQQTANQKADASALSATNARVTTAEGKLTSAGESITRLDNSIASLAGAAGNLLKNSNREIVRPTSNYKIGEYRADKALEVGKTYTLVACITHEPAAGDTTSSVGAWTGSGSQSIATNLVKNAVKKVVAHKFVRNSLSPTAPTIEFYYYPNTVKTGTATIHWACLYDGDVVPPLEWQPSDVETVEAIAANATAIQAASTKVEQLDGKVTSQGTSLTSLSNTINHPQTGLQATADALNQTNTKLDGTEKAVINQQSILQAGLRQLYAEEDAELDKALALWDSYAAIAETRQIVATEVSSMAEIVDIVKTSLGGNSAAVQETLQALVELEGKMIAQWGVNVQLNVGGVPYIAGTSLGIVNEGGVTRSAFNVLADMFNVMHDVNGQPKAVFSVQGGAAIFNAALIAQAAIKSAQIESLDALKIESQNLATVLANIVTAYIDSAHMKEGSIKRLHVGVAEIDTLRIAGNSITVTAVASAPAQITTASSRSTSVGMYLPAAAKAVVTVNVSDVFGNSQSLNYHSVINTVTGAEILKFTTSGVFFSQAANNYIVLGGQFSVVIDMPAGNVGVRLVQPRVADSFSEVFVRIESAMR